MPEFYLKGFTSSNGKFKIFDVEKKQFIENGKEFTPRSYFFERDANTLMTDNSKSDYLEDVYSELDNRFAQVFDRIIKEIDIEETDIAMIQYFIATLYWRIPAHRDQIRLTTSLEKLKKNGLTFKKLEKNLDSLEDEQKLKSDPNFLKIMKFLFPNITYPELFSCNTPVHISSYRGTISSVCGDNPIVFKNPNASNLYKDDYILQLNSTKLFIRGEKLLKFGYEAKIEMDLLVYKQAVKYVSFTNSIYLELLEELFDKNYQNIDELRNSLFSRILG